MIANDARLRERSYRGCDSLEDVLKGVLENRQVGPEFALPLVEDKLDPYFRQTLEVIVHDSFDDDTEERHCEQ